LPGNILETTIEMHHYSGCEEYDLFAINFDLQD